MLEPWWRNFFNNMATVQFDHRLIAWLLARPRALAVVARAARPTRRRARGSPPTCCSALLVLQIALGIATLLAAVPVALGAAHQGGAMLVFAAALFAAHALRPAR